MLRLAVAVVLVGCTSQPLGPVPEPLPEQQTWDVGEARASFLGLKTEENDSGTLDELYFDPGVRVVRVVENSSAERSGIEPGDVVLSFGGQEVSDPAALDALVAGRMPGDVVELEVRRGDTVFSVSVSIEGQIEESADPARPLYRLDPARSRAGWSTVAGGGARLVSQAEDSPMADAGLQPGDVVLTLDGERVLSDRDLVRRLQSLEPGARVEFGLHDGEIRRVRLAEPPTRVTAVFVPILVDYESTIDGETTMFEFLDFWLFAIFRYQRNGAERTWELFEVLEFETGVGELHE